MSRLPDPSRILSLLRIAEVQRGMVSIAEAARILGVPEANVADVAVLLGELGAPPFGPEDLFDIVVTGQWLHIDPPRGYTDFANLTPADVALFRACLRALEPGLDAPLRERCVALEKRLEGLLGAALSSEADQRAQSIAWAVDHGVDEAVVAALHRGIELRRQVQIRYYNQSRNRIDPRTVHPFRMVKHNGRWYLAGADAQDGRNRNWRVDRVLSAEVTEEEAAIHGPEDTYFHRDVLFDAPSERAVADVRFEGASAVAWPRWWPDGQVLSDEDGAVVVRVSQVTTPVLIRQLVSTGDQWTVLGPEPVVQTIRDWFAPCDR